MNDVPEPSVVCDARALLAERAGDDAGVLWRLAESGRQLDANLVHLAADATVGVHAEPDLDVLLFVVSGTGTLTGAGEVLALTAGALTWLPRSSVRSFAAGPNGLSYLTVHSRRPGMQIRSRPDELPPPPPPRS